MNRFSRYFGFLLPASKSEMAFAEGRRFRANHSLLLTDAVPVRWIRFDILDDIDLIYARQSAADGSYNYEVFAGSQIENPSGFTDEIPIYPSNSKSGVPAVASNIQAFGGAAATADVIAGQIPNVTLNLRASSQGNSSVSRTIQDDLPRGFPATTAYARLTKVGNTNAAVVLEYEFDQFD